MHGPAIVARHDLSLSRLGLLACQVEGRCNKRTQLNVIRLNTRDLMVHVIKWREFARAQKLCGLCQS